ncbi:unnamed protein product [Effrenium voratum]|uniref:Peptidase C1A papain C-terminal domain-containing protein n=1 Tax=Effrenium voratum TaxID=2562239 RepID=A0AA36HQZ2_9DINO|nr:unnamed protein product [Effrenium voratum]CAJ1459787.1 unnamed protein product [Effrenium voratum]
MKLVLVAAAVGIVTSSKLRSLESQGLESAYAAFLEQHSLRRAGDAVSHSERLAAFARSRARVAAQNRRAERSWTAGLNRFADHTPEEFSRLLGFKRMGAWWNTTGSFLQTSAAFAESIDWAAKTTTGAYFIDQGACGSCWAVAATGALEMRAEIAHKKAPSMLSYKELLDCVPNPHHCGGDGGCSGATGELAFQYVAQHGLSARKSYHGDVEATESCRPDMRSAVVKANSFVRLPINKLQPLMMAIQEGPVVVSVDGEPWSNYESGVFDGCKRDSTVNHAVLLVGYGRDAQVGKDYWLVRNSWGSWWGEKGFIRVQRHSSDEGEEGYCGTDYDPKQGVGCDGGPSTLPVCGMCGILSDSVYPDGVTAF